MGYEHIHYEECWETMRDDAAFFRQKAGEKSENKSLHKADGKSSYWLFHSIFDDKINLKSRILCFSFFSYRNSSPKSENCHYLLQTWSFFVCWTQKYGNEVQKYGFGVNDDVKWYIYVLKGYFRQKFKFCH